MRVKASRGAGSEVAEPAAGLPPLAAVAGALTAALDRLALAISDVAGQIESLRSLAAAPDQTAGFTALSIPGLSGLVDHGFAALPAARRHRSTTPSEARESEPGGSGRHGRPATLSGATPAPGLHAGMEALLAVLPPEALARLHRELLGPLLALEPRRRTGLYGTLEAYLACGGNVVQTARRLHLHRNTVLYRLERLQRLLGTDVRDPQHRLLLHLALCAGMPGCPSSARDSSILHKDCGESSGKGSIAAG